MKKWSLKLESTQKLSKIGPFENFDFWSKVNAKSQSQLVQDQSQRIHGPSRFRVSRLVTDQAVETLTHLDDVALT